MSTDKKSPAKAKKEVKPTSEALTKELAKTREELVKALEKLCHSENAFKMVKANFEREKNRLDKTIDSLLNVTNFIKE